MYWSSYLWIYWLTGRVVTKGSDNIIKTWSLQLFFSLLVTLCKLTGYDNKMALIVSALHHWRYILKESCSLPRALIKVLESSFIASDWFRPFAHFWTSFWPGLSHMSTLEGREWTSPRGKNWGLQVRLSQVNEAPGKRRRGMDARQTKAACPHMDRDESLPCDCLRMKIKIMRLSVMMKISDIC